MPFACLFTEPRFTAARVAQALGPTHGRSLVFQEANETEDIDGCVDITSRVHVQVGADYLIACAWEDDQTLVTWPARRSVLEVTRDVFAAIAKYPEATL
jgi:hypothetical protein